MDGRIKFVAARACNACRHVWQEATTEGTKDLCPSCGSTITTPGRMVVDRQGFADPRTFTTLNARANGKHA